MRYSVLVFATLLSLTWVAGRTHHLKAAAPPRNFVSQYQRRLAVLPLGYLSGGRVRTCYYSQYSDTQECLAGHFAVARFSVGSRKEKDFLIARCPDVYCQEGWLSYYPFRAKYGFGHAWVVKGWPPLNGRAILGLQRFPTSAVEPTRSPTGVVEFPILERLRKRDLFSPNKFAFAVLDPVHDAESRNPDPPVGLQLPYSAVQWDVIPTGQTTALLVVLSPAEKRITIHELDYDPPAKGKPEPRVEKLSLRFSEGFRAFQRPEGLYFVTESGKVYLSRKTDKGRAWSTVWDDPTRPVRAILVNDDRDGKIYLAGSTRHESFPPSPWLFALARKPKVRDFASWDVKPVDAPAPLKQLAEYAQLVKKMR